MYLSRWFSMQSQPHPYSVVVVVQWLTCVQLFATPWTAHARLLCPSPSYGISSHSCPLSQWCHPTISYSVVPFSYLQSSPAEEKKSQSSPLQNRSLKCLLKIYEKWSVQSGKLFILINHSPIPYPTPPAFLRIYASLCIQLMVFLRQDSSNYSTPC